MMLTIYHVRRYNNNDSVSMNMTLSLYVVASSCNRLLFLSISLFSYVVSHILVYSMLYRLKNYQ